MKKLYTLSFLALLLSSGTFGQDLVSSEVLYNWTAAQLGTQGVFGAQNGVTMLKLIYNTTDPQGSAAPAWAESLALVRRAPMPRRAAAA